MPGPPEESLVDRSIADTMNRYVYPNIESGVRDAGRVLGRVVGKFVEGAEEAQVKTVERLPDLLKEGGEILSVWLSKEIGHHLADAKKPLPKAVSEEAKRTGFESMKHTHEQWERDFQRRHGSPKPTKPPITRGSIPPEFTRQIGDAAKEMAGRSPDDWRKSFEDAKKSMPKEIKRYVDLSMKERRAILDKAKWNRMSTLKKIKKVMGREFWRFNYAIDKFKDVAAMRAGRLVFTLVNTYGWAPIAAESIGGAVNEYYEQRIEEGAIDKPILRQIKEAGQRIRSRDNATRN